MPPNRRPIDEELSRLHNPIVTEEGDMDSILDGFDVTSSGSVMISSAALQEQGGNGSINTFQPSPYQQHKQMLLQQQREREQQQKRQQQQQQQQYRRQLSSSPSHRYEGQFQSPLSVLASNPPQSGPPMHAQHFPHHHQQSQPAPLAVPSQSANFPPRSRVSTSLPTSLPGHNHHHHHYHFATTTVASNPYQQLHHQQHHYQQQQQQQQQQVQMHHRQQYQQQQIQQQQHHIQQQQQQQHPQNAMYQYQYTTQQSNAYGSNNVSSSNTAHYSTAHAQSQPYNPAARHRFNNHSGNYNSWN